MEYERVKLEYESYQFLGFKFLQSIINPFIQGWSGGVS